MATRRIKSATTSEPPKTAPVKTEEKSVLTKKPEVQKKYTPGFFVSTRSTLLDMAISCKVNPKGGIPGGNIVEIFGESGLGKTGLVVEIAANAQRAGGEIWFNDPEGRLNKAYAEIYSGLQINEKYYSKEKYVNKSFHQLSLWEPERTDVVNVRVEDSLAAMTTELEMKDEDGDKMGMRRAKEFSAGLRKIAVPMSEPHKLLLLTNQVRQGDMGLVTPGGKGIPFYSSVRIQLFPYISPSKSAVIDKIKIGKKEKEVEKKIGIRTMCKIVKNSVDDPERLVPIFIIYGYGIDDVRANLQWYKETLGEDKYDCGDGTTYVAMHKAINYIEQNSLQEKVAQQTRDLYLEIESKFEEKWNRAKKF